MRDNSSTFPFKGGERESLDHRTTHYSSIHSTNIWIYVKPTMCQALSRHGEFKSNQDLKSLSSWAICKIRTLCSPKSGLHSSEGVSILSSGVGNQVMGREWDPCISTGDLLCLLPTLMVLLLDGWKLSGERTLHPQSFTPNKCQRLAWFRIHQQCESCCYEHLHKDLLEYLLSVLWGRYLGAELLSHMVILCLTFRGSTGLFPQWWSLHTMKYYWAIRRNEVLMHAEKWMNLENITLSERIQAWKVLYGMNPLIQNIQNGSEYGDKRQTSRSQGFRERGVRVTLKRSRFLFVEMKMSWN